ncbi:OmpA family protein [Shewanella insulae]|uniref:OmpA/MotB family protein n=1 Tax=Shewanella TaxID=22 RepID=UPI001AADACFB|nr:MULTISPECIES: OmpA family protein [Shewanella]MBO2678721.1 OmpA family protein [Shewanella algae]MCG9737676.1 OmpA family protein [Shewanella insulae]
MSIDNELELDEGSGYLVSVSDLMSGLVFIFIITLVAFILNFQDAAQKTATVQKKMETEIERLNAVKKRMESNDYIRAQLLQELQLRLKEEHGIIVNIDEAHGVLRLTENAITFASGSAELNEDNLVKLMAIRHVLEDVLPCFAVNLAQSISYCKEYMAEEHAYLEAIFIEGHTDNIRYRGDDTGRRNWQLSVNRAIRTYMELVGASELLQSMDNDNHEAIFSVSGYGEERPISGHRHNVPTNDKANRRIDLRFIMTPPEFTEAEKALFIKGFKG